MKSFSSILGSLRAGFFRVLRLVGVLALIYVSMVFYMALTERQNAFPRAITHKEANAAIQGKAHPLSCTLEDNQVLGGWSLGEKTAPVVLYYPDSDEDGAQFLAEVENIPGIQLVTFNYRGSGDNKGKPSQETFETDAKQIAECATQVTGSAPLFFVGRGTGAILAFEQLNGNKSQAVFIDPVFSIADAVHEKYRAFYPKFLVRADVQVSEEELQKNVSRITILADRKQFAQRTSQISQSLTGVRLKDRNGGPLKNVLQETFLSN